MTTQRIHWTKKEFLSYLLLYAAHADVRYKEEEKEHILSKIEPRVYEKILKEYSKDNGYQQIQKIIFYQKVTENFSTDMILKEIKALFLSDNYFHTMEKLMLSHIRRLLD